MNALINPNPARVWASSLARMSANPSMIDSARAMSPRSTAIHATTLSMNSSSTLSPSTADVTVRSASSHAPISSWEIAALFTAMESEPRFPARCSSWMATSEASRLARGSTRPTVSAKLKHRSCLLAHVAALLGQSGALAVIGDCLGRPTGHGEEDAARDQRGRLDTRRDVEGLGEPERFCGEPVRIRITAERVDRGQRHHCRHRVGIRLVGKDGQSGHPPLARLREQPELLHGQGRCGLRSRGEPALADRGVTAGGTVGVVDDHVPPHAVHRRRRGALPQLRSRKRRAGGIGSLGQLRRLARRVRRRSTARRYDRRAHRLG